MGWPTPQDYNEAVQNPRLAFFDSDLQTGQPELTPLGLPRPISGNFACVYKIHAGGQRWAARCFISEVSDQQRRYEVISTYLAKAALPYTVQFTYMAAGIKVQGRPYPLLKMQWVQGESLTAFVGRSLGYPDTLLSLAKVWARMMADLKEAGIAHGDLQHGNVLVVGDQFRLIDYDGMFVPELAGKQSNECGHRNYQLPSRTGWDFGPHLDNFSSWVIYVSFVALAVHPELWQKYQGGDECLIFRKEDFLQPESSPLLADLNSSPNTQLRILMELFIGLFSLSPQDVPSLDGNLTQIKVEPPRPWWNDYAESPPPRAEESPAEAKPVEKKPEAPAPDPGWIIDSLMDDAPAKPLAFQGKPKEVRITILGSLALVTLTRLLVGMPAAELLVVISCVFGLNLLVCFIRYKRDPSMVEYEVFKKASKSFVRQVREHQALLDSVAAEQLSFQEKLAKGDLMVAEQKSRWAAHLQAQLDNAQAELSSQLQTIQQRRKELATSETTKLDSLQEVLGNQILEANRTMASLNWKETDEKTRATAALQDHHVQNYLCGQSIAGSWIPGIGDAYKTRLVYSGFNTAADIDWRVNNVQGIGPTRQAALLHWRQCLEREARKSAPTLPSSERQAIENKYRQERQTLEADKQRLQSQFNSQVASVRQYFADVRQSLSQEEQQVQAVHAQKKISPQQEHDAAVASLEKYAVDARALAAPRLSELSDKLRNAQRQIFALRWQSAKHAKEGQRFASLKFRKYLGEIVSS